MFYRFKQFILLVGDVATFYIGLFVGSAIRYLNWPGDRFFDLIVPITPLFFIAAIINFIVGLYDASRARNSSSFFKRIGIAAGVWFIISVFYFYAAGSTVTPKTTLLLTTLSSFGLLALWRAFYNKYLSANFLRVPVVFVGFCEESKELIEMITKYPEHGFQVTGLVSSDQVNFAFPVANSFNEVVKRSAIFPGLIVLSENESHNQETLKDLYGALDRQITVVPLANFYEDFFKRIPPFTFSEGWFLTNLKEQTRKIYDRSRIFADYALALLMSIVFIITFPFIAVAIKTSSRGPILFKQQRVGRLGKVFTIYKYRTMKAIGSGGSAETSGPQFAKINDERITKVGKFLRQTRIDELPQFINILRGEMAMIGPRPERPEFVEELVKQMPFYNLRHLIKPGLTGWAQLHQSYYGTIEENLVKLQYDLYYIKNRGLTLDLTILLKTISVLIRFMGR